MTYIRRPIDELIVSQDSAWPMVQSWVSEARRTVEVLAPDATSGETLVALQVTTRSPMGSIVLYSGGLLVDYGWLRILGSGHQRLRRSLSRWNYQCGMEPLDAPPPWLLVADDAVGGFFALDGGRFGSTKHSVWYFSPDALEWEDLGIGYSDFVHWSMTGDVDGFYSNLRWTGWEREVQAISGDECIVFEPPFDWSQPASADHARRLVAVNEVFLSRVGEV